MVLCKEVREGAGRVWGSRVGEVEEGENKGEEFRMVKVIHAVY